MTDPAPERIRIPAPVGNAYVDYLEVRIAQALCRKVGRRDEEGRAFAFAMGMATARWVYCLQEDIQGTVVEPTQFVALIKGRLATLSAEDTAKLMTIPLESVNYSECRRARRAMAELLSIEG